jgi:putative ABC transport system ATP-binding protein
MLPSSSVAENSRQSGPLARAALVHLHSIDKVHRGQGAPTVALREVFLDIGAGEFVAIVGPSGCGKSTLLSILGLLDRPSNGTYEFEGRPVHQLSRAESARIRNERMGFIFQSFHLVQELSVLDNVALPLALRGLATRERRDRAADALDRLGLLAIAARVPSELSGGQQQRVAIARAVVGQPRLLLADEPTGNLDSANGELVLELLHQLHRQGATVCLVTHDVSHHSHVDRIVRMQDGRICDATDHGE